MVTNQTGGAPSAARLRAPRLLLTDSCLLLRRHIVAVVFLALLNIPHQPLMLRGGDIVLGSEPGGVDAGVLGIEDQPWLLPVPLRFVEELLRHALLGEEFVDMLLPARLDVGKFHRATPFSGFVFPVY